MTCVNISRDISVIYAIVLFPGALQRTGFSFSAPLASPSFYQKTFWTNVHGKARNVEKGIYILFLFFISFLKIPYLKIVENFVLSCKPCIFVIYYINNQIFIRCTIFVRNRTIRTKVHKILFCTEHYNFVLKSTAFCTEITS